MTRENSTWDQIRSNSFHEQFCLPELTIGVHDQLIFVIILDIFVSITAFLGNALILIALYKESSLRPPTKLLFRCLATTDLLVGILAKPLVVINLVSVLEEERTICYYTSLLIFVVGYILSSVSLFTLTAVSVDRLLALFLGLRYRQVVTLKKTYVLVLIFWIVAILGTTMYFWNHLITSWYGYIGIVVCLVTSVFSYTKIFLSLRHHQVSLQHQASQEQPRNHPLNIVRYRKAVTSALLLQLTLVVCYVPFAVADALMTQDEPSPTIFIVREFTVTLLHLNSSLNPVLYCWKIRELRQAVKEIIRDCMCSLAE